MYKIAPAQDITFKTDNHIYKKRTKFLKLNFIFIYKMDYTAFEKVLS